MVAPSQTLDGEHATLQLCGLAQYSLDLATAYTSMSKVSMIKGHLQRIFE